MEFSSVRYITEKLEERDLYLKRDQKEIVAVLVGVDEAIPTDEICERIRKEFKYPGRVSDESIEKRVQRGLYGYRRKGVLKYMGLWDMGVVKCQQGHVDGVTKNCFVLSDEYRLLDIDNILKECLDEDYELLNVYRPFLEDEDDDYRHNEVVKKIYHTLKEKKVLLSKIRFLSGVGIEPISGAEFDDGLSKCTLRHGDYELALNNPLLLWECSCKVPEDYINAGKPCRIHSEGEAGKIIGEVFGKKFTEIKYNDVGVLWLDEEPLWPPAIDSIFMAKILKEKGYGGRMVGNVLDIGCGTGFLGIFFAKINSHVKESYFSDLFLTPLLMTKLNWELNFDCGKEKSIKLFLSDHYMNIPSQEIPPSGFDMVICNPPYLPALDFVGVDRIYREAGVSGTRLLENVVMETKKYGKELVIGCSSLAMEEFNKAVKNAKSTKELLGSREIPFRIPQAFKYEDFMGKLVASGRIKQKDEGSFKYFHTFHVFKIRY